MGCTKLHDHGKDLIFGQRDANHRLLFLQTRLVGAASKRDKGALGYCLLAPG
jgi:hypothetical protein